MVLEKCGDSAYDLRVLVGLNFLSVGPIEKFFGDISYRLVVTDYMKDRLNGYTRLNSNPELSLQIMYRDGYTEDLWPKWDTSK